MMMFASVLPEKVLAMLGKIHLGRPIEVKTRKELLTAIRPHQWQYLREDNGDVPQGAPPPPQTQRVFMAQAV